MVVIPKDKPIITGMNSYYLDIERLVEHYNGEMESGVIFFHSNTAEGAIFFDDHIPLTGVHETQSDTLDGPDAIRYLTDNASSHNFSVSVYGVTPDMVHYWANLTTATALHSNLSTEFTELKALISKLQTQKFTGYIDIDIAGGEHTAGVFFNFGTIIAARYSWEADGLHVSKKLIRELLAKADSEGAVLHVYQAEMASAPETKPESAESEPDLAMIEDFLVIFETVVMSRKEFRSGFLTALKKKFIENADRYDFLDPFAAEFEYEGGSISFNGNASLETIAHGVTDSALNLADDMDLRNDLLTALEPWFEKYGDAVSKFGLKM